MSNSGVTSAFPGISAVLWDMDGTLVDTDEHWLAIHEQLVTSHGGVWSAELGQALTGQTMAETTRLMNEAGADITEDVVTCEEYRHMVAATRHRVNFRPGAVELLTEIHGAGVPCALVTASKTALTEPVLSHLPQQVFSVVVSEESVTHGKPHPEPYNTAFDRLHELFPQIDAGTTLVIEDSIPGVRSGLAAGFRVLAVDNVTDLSVFDDQLQVRRTPSLAQWQLGDLGGVLS